MKANDNCPCAALTNVGVIEPHHSRQRAKLDVRRFGKIEGMEVFLADPIS